MLTTGTVRRLAMLLLAQAFLLAPTIPVVAEDLEDAEERVATIQRLTHEYFSARDGGRYEDAYGLFAPSTKETIPFAGYKAQIANFNRLAGAVLERRIIEFTVYQDPANAPLPGIYVAVDFVSKFQNIDRHCGYLMFHQPPDGQFMIMREEENYIDHATEQSIRESGGEGKLEKVWAELAKNCP